MAQLQNILKEFEVEFSDLLTELEITYSSKVVIKD